MKSIETPANRKTGRLVAKNLIILLVLVAVCGLSIWAWFTKGSTAIANGINVRSRADGVQVSWDGETYYDNLTALTDSAVTGTTGLAKSLLDADGNPLNLSLVTGNGLNFFEPYLNRRTGDVILDGSAWQGFDITADNSTGRYIDIELYFRGTSARDIYLAGDSAVSPKSESDRLSDYGAFSKDNIASASRVAFLTGEGEDQTCSFIWAPNADCELKENESGYTKYTTTDTEDVTISGGGTTDVDGGVVDNGKTYYFWTFWDDSVVTAYPNDLSKFEARKFVYDENVRYFVTEVTTYIPTYGGDNPSIPIFINESSSASATSFNSYNTYIDGASSKNTIKESQGQYFGVTNTNFNIGDATCSNAMYIINGKIKPNAKITYKLGYDPDNRLLVVLSYSVDGGGSFDLGGQESDIVTTVTYFPLENNTNCALVNPTSSFAVSSGENYKNSVNFKSDSDKNNVLPVSITTAEQYTAVKTGDGYAATYKFRNVKTNQYLNISNGTVSFDASGSAFTLYYMSGVDSPLLKSGDYYLVVNNGTVSAVKVGNLDVADAVTVYTGSSYEFNTGLSTDAQPYQYYDSELKSLVNLGSSTSPKLFTSANGTDATVKVGNTPIATLEKANEADEYFTAHIVMRVWVEGTDREAKTPLADGIFDMSLHFISL